MQGEDATLKKKKCIQGWALQEKDISDWLEDEIVRVGRRIVQRIVGSSGQLHLIEICSSEEEVYVKGGHYKRRTDRDIYNVQ